MKKLILIISLILMVLVLASCSKGEVPKEEKIDLGKTECEANASSPIKTVNEVKDAYGNILQQILLDTRTGDMFIYDYTYKFDGTAFYCTGSWMTLVEGNSTQGMEDITIHKPTIDVEYGWYYNIDVEKKLLINSGDVKVWLVGYEYDATLGEHLFKLEATSTGDKPVVVRTDKETVNKTPMYSQIRMDETLYANETASFVICIEECLLEDEDILSIKDFTFDLIICSTQDYGGILAKERPTIKFTEN